MTALLDKRIHNDTIEELKQRADIIDVISKHVALKKRGKTYMGPCPFHDERTPSFSVSPIQQLYHCFGCVRSGNVFQFLMELNKTSFRDTVLELARDFGVRVKYEDGTCEGEPPQPRPQRQLASPAQASDSTETTPGDKVDLGGFPSPSTNKLTLVRLGAPATDSPLPQKPQFFPKGVPTHAFATTYKYHDYNRGVTRYQWEDSSSPKGHQKTFRQWHIDETGKLHWSKGEQPFFPYRCDEAIEASDKTYEKTLGVSVILTQEGEECVEAARRVGLASMTFQGSEWKEEDLFWSLRDLTIHPSDWRRGDYLALAHLWDNDKIGFDKARELQKACAHAGIIYLGIDPLAICPDLPDKGDIVEILKRMDAPEFIRRLEAEIHKAVAQQEVDKQQKKVDKQQTKDISGDAELEKVTLQIDELIAQGAKGSLLTGQLNRLAAANQFGIAELRKLYYERLGEVDLEIERDDNRNEVGQLLKLSDQALNLHDYLPEYLATPLTNWCECLNMRPEVVLFALLTGVSSLHKTGTELIIHRNQNFRVPPTIFAALVSPSGQRKSPVFSNIIRQPLSMLRSEKVEAYNAAMEDYQAELKTWQETENKGPKPEEPRLPSLYYFTNATGEAIPVQASKDPGKPLLALIDELAGLLKSENSYRNGRGSDKQDLLSYFDGSGQTVLRVGGVRVDLQHIYLSIFGTIQPEILRTHMQDCSDPDGQWARFLFVNQPLAAATLTDDDGQAVQICDRILEFYRKIDQLPEIEYRLSREAFRLYQPVYNQLERLRVTHPKSGMSAVYSKMEGYIGRIAQNLHVIWELAAGKKCPDEEIPSWIMEMSIQLAKFCIGQVKLIHSFASDEELPPQIVKLIELSKRFEINGVAGGWVKAKDVQNCFTKKRRPSPQQVRGWMEEAIKLGHGHSRGSGNRLEYHWRKEDSDGDDSVILGDDCHRAEKPMNKGLFENSVTLGDTPSSVEPSKSEEEISLEGGGHQISPSPATADACKLETTYVSDSVTPITELSPSCPHVTELSSATDDNSVNSEGEKVAQSEMAAANKLSQFLKPGQRIRVRMKGSKRYGIQAPS